VKLLLRLFLLLFVLGAVALGAAWYVLGQPYKGFTGPVFLDIPRGMGTRQIASALASRGVIPSEWHFYAARLLRPGRHVQAGEYQFAREASPWQVYDRLARGDIFYLEVTFPEGSNIFDMAEVVQQTGIIKREEFLKVARDPALIRDLAPGAPSLEGYLFPATYRMTRRTTARQLCRDMTGRFRRAWADVGGGKSGKGKTNDLVTLASLVEKETAVASERPLVASVYWNRLKQGVKLDCDPTVIYAALLEGRYRGTIYRSDLDNDHPYNTYRRPGLPPGPIANPGLASLKATLAPAQTSYLYFVAKPDGSGGHNFSNSLSDHNRAVAEYRRGSQ
jgi:UPF0755 protein